MRFNLKSRMVAFTAALSALALLIAVFAGGSSARDDGAKVSATKAPIKLFVYGDETNVPPLPAAHYLQDIPAATVKAINGSGGIRGAKVEMTFCDSKANPNATSACARQAISGGYAAVIDTLSNGGPAGADALLGKAKIPVIHSGAAPSVNRQKNATCASPVQQTLTMGVSQLAKGRKFKKAAIVSVDVPTVTGAINSLEKQLPKSGVKVTNKTLIPVATSNWSAVFAKAMADNPDVLILFHVDPLLTVAVKQFRARYPKTKLVLPLVQSSTLTNVGGNLNGIVFTASPSQPLSMKRIPGIKLYNSVMAKYGPKPTYAGSDAMNWFSASLLFWNAAKSIKGNVTAASMTKALNSAHFKMGGITPDFNGKKKGVLGTKCLYHKGFVPLVSKNNVMVPINPDGKFTDLTTGKRFK